MRVLIIGAGSAGLLMAHVFKKCNIDATVFEQDASPTARPRDWTFGIYWAQSRLEECLPSEITNRLHTVQADPNAKPSADSVLPIYDGITGEMLSPAGAPFAVRYRRRAWLGLIGEGVDIRYGKRIAKVVTSDDGVTAIFTDGTEEKGDLVIGAEGAHSVVRDFLFESTPEDGKLLSSPIVASATVGTMDPEVALAVRKVSNLCHITLDKNGLFTFVSTHDVSAPDPADWVFVIVMSWASYEDTSAKLKTYDQIHKDMVSRVQDLAYPFKDAITTFKPDGDRCWHARMTYWPTKPWDSRGGKVTLAGDAAHAMTFHRGQGLGNAISDAAEMLQHLRGMAEHTPAELAKAVKRYEEGMWPRGLEAVEGNLENTVAIHNWEFVMKSPIVVKGLKKEGDKVRVNETGAEGVE
ncbi:FAD/NAD(P)-binding domain-containing protein [Podospora aff. communis PSN243]|uniref:FAD/NAD(P)-binding domain-containing protein n=1 Tax=Podospora aff. communis PSN243 TaxID=3040156 RepID=A0AAV9GC06_9PEZI|nr:FAD/NAD(P)-binding domain-containing protein [Podospora aff. communis PSN243]